MKINETNHAFITMVDLGMQAKGAKIRYLFRVTTSGKVVVFA